MRRRTTAQRGTKLRRRRPMPRAAFERYSLVGMAIVLMLFFIGLDNDITRARG